MNIEKIDFFQENFPDLEMDDPTHLSLSSQKIIIAKKIWPELTSTIFLIR